jgi:hypothetical protein
MFYMCQRFTTNQYKDKRKGSKQRSKVNRVSPGLAHRTVRCTREINSKLASFGNSGSHSAIIHRTVRCSTGLSGVPAEQWLTRANGRLQRNSKREQCAPACVEVRAGARRRTGQWTGPVRCTTGLSGGPHVRSSNRQTLTVGWRGWRTGQCPVVHQTVRCPHRQQPSPTATLVVGAVNTPNHHPFKASMFQPFAFNTRALDFTPRHKQEIKSSP